MRIVIEPAGLGERRAQRILAGMAERRMAEVVGQAQGLGQIFVQAERARDRPPDLRDLQAVRQAHPVMIAVGRDEDLRLVTKPPEGDRMDQPVAVALENIAWAARAAAVLGVEPAAGSFGTGGNERRKRHSPASGAILSAWELVKFEASMPTDAKSSAKNLGVRTTAEGPDEQACAARRPRDIGRQAVEQVADSSTSGAGIRSTAPASS